MHNKKYDFAVYIGRMQPPTQAHLANINEALNIANRVIILLGSSFQPRTIKNPWSYTERAAMILNELPAEVHSRITIRPIKDYRYNDQEWVAQVQHSVKTLTTGYSKPKIAIIGCKKDNTSYYLDYFPQWSMITIATVSDINATQVREQYFEGSLFNWHDYEFISEPLKQYLKKWSQSEEYQNLQEEYECIKKYQESWSVAPYAPTFVTVDACVIQSGHILLVQRRSSPGKNLWALPGGFINPNEYIRDAVIRELREETRIKIPEPILRGSVIGSQVFDNPSRSLRGRTITHAFAFQLPLGELAKVKGSDDAAKAQWFTLDDALDMEEHLFEDHSELVRWAISIAQ